MGSLFSFERECDPNSSSIESSVQNTKIADYDQFFYELSLKLGKAEITRLQIDELWNSAVEISGVWVLSVPSDSPSLFKLMIESFLWTISAEAGGNMTKYNLKKSNEVPLGISLEMSQLSNSSQKIFLTLSQLADTLSARFPVLQEISADLKNSQESVLDKVLNVKNRCKELGLSVEETINAVNIVGNNAKIVETGILRTKKLYDFVNEILKSIKAYSQEISLMMLKAREVGEQASKAKKFEPEEIVKEYHYLPKASSSEIAKKRREIKRRESGSFCC